MEAVFLRVLNMSLTASYVILFVLAARLLLKKAPKIFSYTLWGIVLFRLICPFSFEGLFSLLLINPELIPNNITYAEVPQINTGIDLVDSAANPILSAQAAAPGASVNPVQVWAFVGGMIWLVGIAVLLIYSVISLFRLRYKLVGAVKWRDNIYLADHIASPFVMGLLRPKIYLPSTLSEREQEYIILHEQTHIKRLDHIVKIVAFFVLTVYWFNPLVWLAFVLCMKDMEMSCDESVMKRMDTDIRQEYSASLLSLATDRKITAGIPLAFGEGDTKERIKNVMNYKKPAFWIVAAGVVVCIVLVVCLIANPRTDSSEWQPQPEYENRDDYLEALDTAQKSVKTEEEIAVDDQGSNEKTARAWMEVWFDMYKALPKDNMAHIAQGEVDSLEISQVSKEGLPKAFIFSVTFSVRPTYPILSNGFWMPGNTGNSPVRDETWGQMSRVVELRQGDDGRYHFVSMGTGGASDPDIYDLVDYEPEYVIEEQKAQIEQYEKIYELRNVLDIETRKLLSALNSGMFGEDEKELLNDSIEIKEDRLEISFEGHNNEILFFQNKLDFEHVRQRDYDLDEQGRFNTGYEVVFSDDTQEFNSNIMVLVFTYIESPSGWKLAHIGEDA